MKEETKDVSASTEAVKEEQVTVSKSELAQLLKQNELLAKRIEKIEAGVDEVAEDFEKKQVVIRAVEVGGKNYIVTGLKDRKPSPVYRIYDEIERDDVLYVDLILEGGKIHPMKYLSFLREAEVIKATIVERREVKTERKLGVTRVSEYNGKTMEDKGQTVVMKESTVKTMFLLELNDGTQVEVDERVVNTATIPTN